MQEENLNLDDLLINGGIPRNLVHFSKIDIDHFICPICLNIIWKPVACAQDRCFQSYCESCINRWVHQKKQNFEPNQVPLQEEHQSSSNESQNELHVDLRRSLSATPSVSIDHDSSYSETSADLEWQDENFAIDREPAKCPKCKRIFKQTSIPIIHNLLEAIEFNCIHQGCNEKPKYEQFQKHITNCEFRKLSCNGCSQIFQQSELNQHQQQCEFVQVRCKECSTLMMRQELTQKHPKDQCIQRQFEEKDVQIQRLQEQLNQQKQKVQHLEIRLEKLSKGDFENIQEFSFKTSFTTNYNFQQGAVKLIRLLQRNSYNQQKQKNDFLHFYMNVKMKTQCLIGQQWKIKLNKLQGHLLLGICSSLCHHSIDFIINRLGEVKKKEWNENKYKQMRKVNFTFQEGDILFFQYLPFQQQLRILNETKHLVCRFECTEMVEMGDSFYCFFSLEQAGDNLQFL